MNIIIFIKEFNKLSKFIEIKNELYIKINPKSCINDSIDFINNIIKLYKKQIKNIRIIFDESINIFISNYILTKLHDLLYEYPDISKYILTLENAANETKYLMNELTLYKNIVINPNKNPELYCKYILSRIPNYYNTKIFNLKNTDLFSLTKAVGAGSIYDSYFLHIFPKNDDINKKNIYLIGKSVTYDTGGLNLKSRGMEEMKTDMAGSAIMVSVLNLLNINNIDIKFNIHVFIPVVENMISNTATKPGTVIKTMNNKLVEIYDTDAEGRLCIADAIEYINLNLRKENSLIIDIATLTGNTVYITGGVSSITTCNASGYEYINKLIDIGNNIDEYVDYLQLRKEYLNTSESKVAHISNINTNLKCGCMTAAAFLNYFNINNIPWIHIDVGSCVYIKQEIKSYGINLLFEFIKSII
jgi:leucyl aminopeptidase